MISFVYFDVGGVVVLDISDQKSWDGMKKDMGIPPQKFDHFDEFFDKQDLELNISKKVDALIPTIESQFGVQFPKNYSIQKELVTRFKKNKSIWPIIGEIKKHCPVGLLTNMYPGMLDDIYKKGLMPTGSWDVTIDSSLIGYQKPEFKMYEFATKMVGVEASEILFIDNSPTNIKAASDFGWQTFLYDPLNLADSNAKLLVLLQNSWKN
ncbi:MAG: HAD-IA family hydrolase [Patescibacteria group bacterium]